MRRSVLQLQKTLHCIRTEEKKIDMIIVHVWPPGIILVKHNDVMKSEGKYWNHACQVNGCQIYTIQVDGKQFSVGQKILLESYLKTIRSFEYVHSLKKWSVTFEDGEGISTDWYRIQEFHDPQPPDFGISIITK
jgi:hypothetical protein